MNGDLFEAEKTLKKLYSRGNIALSFVFFSQKLNAYISRSRSLYRNSFFNIDRQLALKKIRQGEQANCQLNHNDNSCILPFKDNAKHTNQEGSKEAINYLNNVIKKNKHDFLSIYLREIAKATLGVSSIFTVNLNEDNSVFFENRASKYGVNFLGYYGGAIIEDFNNNGFLDLFATSGRLSDNAKMYWNKNFIYQESSTQSLDNTKGGVHAIQADFNNDGYVDIYIIRGGWLSGDYHPNSLLKNLGNGNFIDVTKKANLLDYRPSHSAVWSDINLDGFLDLIVGYEEGPSKIYLNDRNESFVDISDSVGFNCNCMAKGLFASDLTNNGLPDIYISCYDDKNMLFINYSDIEKGNILFKESAKHAGVQKPNLSFPTAIFDFNNDGFNDIICFSYEMNMFKYAKQIINKTENAEPSKIYINNGDGTFKELELSLLNYSYMPMGFNFADLDNDGFIDIAIGSGFPDYDVLLPNKTLRNLHGKNLENISIESGLGHLQKGHGIAFGDVNRNGKVDAYVSLGGFYDKDNFENAFFINESENNNSWIVLKLVGINANKSAIGARIKIKTLDFNGNEQVFFNEVNSGGSYGSSSLQVEMGLGEATLIKELQIKWPYKESTHYFYDIEPNNFYIVVEDNTELKKIYY